MRTTFLVTRQRNRTKSLDFIERKRMKKNSPKLLFNSFTLFLSFVKVLIVTQMAFAQNTTSIKQVEVGVILNLEFTTNKVALSCINMALSDFYASNINHTTRIVINPRDAKNDVVIAAASALDLIKNKQVQAILGPGNSMQADFVIELGEKARVPIITFSASSPSLTSIRSPYFLRATQSDSMQVNTISAVVQAFGWRQAVPIYVDNEFGLGVVPYLTDGLQLVNCHVPYRSAIPPSATDDQIVGELYKLMTMQTRVFIMHMFPASLGSRVFLKAKQVGMMSEGYAWIMTDSMTNFFSTLMPSVLDSMQGVLGVRPYVPKTKKLEDFRVRWRLKFQRDNPDITDPYELDVFSLWGYDAATALAMAIEKSGTSNLVFQKPNVSNSGDTTDLEAFGVSENGPNLLQTLLNISFRGLAGDFRFVDGQLPASTYQVVNVNGNGAKSIGFWTSKNGLVKNLKSLETNTISTTTTSTKTYSPIRSSLGNIIWPGDSLSVPKGWEIPTNGKKLRVGVPVIVGFSEFVKVTKDNMNTTTVTGYSIDFFDAVISELPYAISPEYIPFAKPDGTMAGTYDDLTYQVFLGKYDAVVGDVTIIANRSKYIDYSMPYTESGVWMIVPVRDSESKNAWVFLKPLTWDLWVTTFFFFLFIGFVIYVLEHRINKDFRGPPSHQAGTSLWFSFSIMVFAHREAIVSNLSRVVVIIWCFVVLILTQSYTATLTSLLTVQQLQPTVSSVNDLIKRGDFVGYKDGSFVQGILRNLGFDKSKLRVYNSIEELDQLFSNGSSNGGIAAAFDEVPYIKLFLSQYCSKYTMMEPTFKTDGFGFVFPLGSPLVPDVSRAVLRVNEGERMKKQYPWLKPEKSCPDPSTLISSNGLSLKSFWGLFLIAGAASVLALTIFVVGFIYRNRTILQPSESGPTVWSRVAELFRVFNSVDMEAHTMRHRDDRGSIDAPLMTNASPITPSVFSTFLTPPSQVVSFPSPNGQLSPSPSTLLSPPPQALSDASTNVQEDTTPLEPQEAPNLFEIALSSIELTNLLNKQRPTDSGINVEAN